MSGSEYFQATYRIASYLPLRVAAEILAGEQSFGTFIQVAGESEALRARHGAVVVDVSEAGQTTEVLPGSYNPKGLDKANLGIVKIAFPEINVGPSLAGLMNTVAGNLYELRDLAAIRLIDLDIPDSVLRAYPGPTAGIQGTRDRISADLEGAIIGTIIKPSIGLPLPELGDLVGVLAGAGIDFIKDDEINCDPPWAPLAGRIKTVMPKIERSADVLGKKTMYAFNVTDDLDAMLRNVDLVERFGGTCIMVTVPTIGLPALRVIREHTELPIHGHRAGFGAFGRSEILGMSYAVYQKCARLAGADHLHVGGVNSKFFERNDSVVESVRAIREPLGRCRSTLPVLSSAQSAATAEVTYELLGSDDVMVLAGGGISGHPLGVAAGVASMQAAWGALRAGKALSVEAESSPALRVALEQFGAGS